MTTTKGRIRVEPSPKRVRVLFGGVYVADSRDVKLVWEHPHYPLYYFPAEDVRSEFLLATGTAERSPSRGSADVYTVKVGDREAPTAAWWYRTSLLDELTAHVKFDWNAMDGWFEEEEQVFVHPRDPYTRIDVLQSARHVRVEVDGVTVADTRQPRLLFETGLPTRYYIPKTDVRMDLLVPSEKHTECPYKGTASYYDVVIDEKVRQGLVWWYPIATGEAAKIAGYVSFYDEHVDVYIDDALQERPRSAFR